jgi:hypothetical protein
MWRETWGRTASTNASETGRTGSCAPASVRPLSTPGTALGPWRMLGEINSDSTAHLNARTISPIDLESAEARVDHCRADRLQGRRTELARERLAVELPDRLSGDPRPASRSATIDASHLEFTAGAGPVIVVAASRGLAVEPQAGRTERGFARRPAPQFLGEQGRAEVGAIPPEVLPGLFAATIEGATKRRQRYDPAACAAVVARVDHR